MCDFYTGLYMVDMNLLQSFSLRMPAPVLFLSSEFFNFWICYTLWNKTKGNIKRNSLFGRYFLLETNFLFLKSVHFREKRPPRRTFLKFLLIVGCLPKEKEIEDLYEC